MYKLVLFDVGGVITHQDWDLFYSNFAERAGVPAQSVKDFHDSNLDTLLLGNISFDESLQKMGVSNIEQGKQVWLEEAMKLVQLDKQVINIADELRKSYKVAILTNNSESRVPIDEALKIYSHFDEVFLSSTYHLIKPDEKFFRLPLDKYGCTPAETIFIDDTASHVETANKLGIHGIVFQDSHQLKTEIQKLGFKIN